MPPGRENPVQHSTPPDQPLSQDNFSARSNHCGDVKVQQLSPPYIVHSHLAVSSLPKQGRARRFSQTPGFAQKPGSFQKSLRKTPTPAPLFVFWGPSPAGGEAPGSFQVESLGRPESLQSCSVKMKTLSQPVI